MSWLNEQEGNCWGHELSDLGGREVAAPGAVVHVQSLLFFCLSFHFTEHLLP